MQTMKLIFPLLLLAVLLTAGCQDENPLQGSTGFTGLWTTPGADGDQFIIEFLQDGDSLSGGLYIERVLEIEGPMAILDYKVSGESIFFSIDKTSFEGNDVFADTLYFRGGLDTPNVMNLRLYGCREGLCQDVPLSFVRDASGF